MANAINEVLARRVLSRHDLCSYCGSKFSSASALRRHIKSKEDHRIYRQFLAKVFAAEAPLSLSDATDPYTPAKPKLSNIREQQPSTYGLKEPSLEEDGSPSSALSASSRHRAVSQASRTALDLLDGKLCKEDVEAISETSLHTIQKCPKWKNDIWAEACGMPQVVQKGAIYPTEQEHTDPNMFYKFLTTESAKVQIFVNGIAESATTQQKRRYLHELAYNHRQEMPLHQHGSFRVTASAVLDKGDKDMLFHVPQLDGDLVPQHVEDTEVIWASHGAVTAAHVDHGKHVISSGVDQCRKLFFLWPPTENNLRILDRSVSLGLQRLAIHSRLAGGLVVDLTGQEALRMKSGTIHEVWTYVGGFIVTKGYLDRSALLPMSRWLTESPSHLSNLNEEDIDSVIDNWITAAHLASSEDQLIAWTLAGESFLNLLRVRPQMRKKVYGFLERAARTVHSAWAQQAKEALRQVSILSHSWRKRNDGQA